MSDLGFDALRLKGGKFCREVSATLREGVRFGELAVGVVSNFLVVLLVSVEATSNEARRLGGGRPLF